MSAAPALLALLAPLLAPTARAADWFYPGPGDARVELAADGTIGGLPVGRTGRIVARLLDPEAVAALPGVREVEPLPGRRGAVGLLARVHLAPGTDELALSRALHDRADVAWAHPDLVLPLVPTAAPILPDDPLLAAQWHLANDGQDGRAAGADVDAPTAWALATGAGGLVAIIDSGVDPAHPDLEVTVGWDYIDGDADSSPAGDDSGPHGTACAGLAAAVGDNGAGVAGVAYEAGVYGVRLIGEGTSLSDMYDAFVEATDAGAWVLSNSWSFGETCATFPTYATLLEALQYVEEEGRGGLGAVVVASAGNGDCDISGDGFQAYQTVVSVAASNSQDARESYSSYGDWVDITAPSGGVLTTDVSGGGGYGSYGGDPDYWAGFSGTSASAPIVAGVFALMLEANPRLTAAQARQVLCETAVPIDPEGEYADGAGYDAAGWSPYYGCGRVDAGAAVLAVANTAPGAPTPLVAGAELPEDRVLLAWEEAADADGDWLSYEVGYTVDEGEEQVVVVEGLHLDLTGAAQAGQAVEWWVRAVDLWGPGPASAPQAAWVVAPVAARAAPAPAAGCSAAPSGGWTGLLLALVGLRRGAPARRRARRGSP